MESSITDFTSREGSKAKSYNNEPMKALCGLLIRRNFASLKSSKQFCSVNSYSFFLVHINAYGWLFNL